MNSHLLSTCDISLRQPAFLLGTFGLTNGSQLLQKQIGPLF
jgi:hypothetical protein